MECVDIIFFFKQKTAYEMRISDWSSDVCSSDLLADDDKDQQGETGDERISTGSEGLDAILGGGLDPDRMYLYEGRPGTGKTTIALQFLLAGVRRGERVLYITLSETRRELALVDKRNGWTLDGTGLFEMVPPAPQDRTSAGEGKRGAGGVS